MGGRAPPVRRGVLHDEPGAHRRSSPTVLRRDAWGQAALPVQRPEGILNVYDLGLQLDYQHRPTARVPPKQVDHAALTVDRKRDLGQEEP